MKTLFVLVAVLAVARAQWGPTQQALQNTNANAGAGGTAIGTGQATANMQLGAPGGPARYPCYPGSLYWPQCQYYPPSYYGGGSNLAQQTTNANAGAGGTAIGSGTATANYQAPAATPYYGGK